MLAKIFLPDTPQQIETIRNLGLENEWLHEVGMKALAAYNQTTALDAANAAGTYAYLAAIRAIRDILCPKGWEPHARNNLEMTINPKTNVSIIVSSGNKDTGRKTGNPPKTKNPKGIQTKRVVAFNAAQYRLPTMEYKVKNISLSRIWILLFHTDIEKSQMRLELSLPVEMDVDGLHVSGWHERIILPAIDFDHTPSPPKSPQDALPEFTIQLKRKSNG